MVLIHIASHPVRFKILKVLYTEKGYASNIGEKIKMGRKITAFHLNTLERYKLVKSEYGLNYDPRPAAVRYYEITKNGREIFEKIKTII